MEVLEEVEQTKYPNVRMSYNSYNNGFKKDLLMKKKATSVKIGNSVGFILPAEWRHENNVEAGDVLMVTQTPLGALLIEKVEKANQAQAFDELFNFVGTLPDIPWTREDSKEADREYWSQDYE